MPDFDKKGMPDNYTGKYEQRGSEFYGHGNQHSKGVKGMPMIEGAAGAMGMISGMMNKKKEDSPTDYKSPTKNYRNPQDYKVFNFGNEPTPVKYEKDPKKFAERKEAENSTPRMTVTRTDLKTGKTSDPKTVKTKKITKDEFFSG